MKAVRNGLAVVLGGVLLAGCDSPEAPAVDDRAEPRLVAPWIRSAPPAASVMAGYLTVEAGTGALEIVAAECDGFGVTEIHETRTVDGVASMRSVASVPVAAGKTVDFEPGGLHLMLMSPARIPAEGETVRCRLRLAGGATLAFEAPVQPGGEADDDHAHHHH